MRRPASHCRNGHDYTNENTYVSRDGSRMCRICRNEARRKEAAKRRAPWALKRERELRHSSDPTVILCRAELERILSKRAEHQRWVHEQMEARRVQWPQPTWRDSVGYMRRDA